MNLDDNGKNLDADLAITIYRVTQEALNNVAQHSNADQVALTLAVSQHEVNLAIEDDGIGIPPDSDIATGIGIASMKNRVERLRGTFSLARGTGTGCRVSARWSGASVSSRR
jgi:signal transduction histidine kinase